MDFSYTFFKNFTFTWIAFGFIVFLILLFVSAPYGRHSRRGWGPQIPNKLGWIVMELPSLLVFSWFFFRGDGPRENILFFFYLLYATHYVNRSLIYPFRIKTSGKQMPALIALFAIFFNVINGSLNGIYFSEFAPEYGVEWLKDPRFIIGLLLFVSGMLINLRSDNHLLGLRKSNPGEYKIPRGGLFEYISSPNFFGEVIEWTGFAILTWSPAALAFALWTFFNLLPRALEHHKWYIQRFEDYPQKRKALIPFIV